MISKSDSLRTGSQLEIRKYKLKSASEKLNVGAFGGNCVVFATIFHSFRDILISNCSRQNLGNPEISIEINRNQLGNQAISKSRTPTW
jgi:hypothetical protein